MSCAGALPQRLLSDQPAEAVLAVGILQDKQQRQVGPRSPADAGAAGCAAGEEVQMDPSA